MADGERRRAFRPEALVDREDSSGLSAERIARGRSRYAVPTGSAASRTSFRRSRESIQGRRPGKVRSGWGRRCLNGSTSKLS
jgi:hypothetical protein